MFNFNTHNYINNISRTPNQMWKELNQATINSMWNDTTQIYNIKEQNAFPFTNEYTEYEAWLSTVSDDLINTSKVYSDFVRILFKDIDHKQNYKGQYYKINLDNNHEETYICYDRMNKLTQISDFKCVRCNNVLTWLDEYGNILRFPCYLGTDISSTNNLINKDGIIPNLRMIILIQANKYTKSIVANQRFLFQHSTAVKVEEINDFMWEQDTNEEVTCIKMYVNYSSILPTDNIELNLTDYYNINYNLTIDQDNIEQINGTNGKLSATIKYNGQPIDDLNVIWESSDNSVITIDKYGNYEIVGQTDDNAIITCIMEDNVNIKDSITVTVIGITPTLKEIVVNPNDITILHENQTAHFVCGVYMGGVLQSQNIECIIENVSEKCYTLTQTADGYDIKINKRSNIPMRVRFISDNCEDYIIDIKLIGLL